MYNLPKEELEVQTEEEEMTETPPRKGTPPDRLDLESGEVAYSIGDLRRPTKPTLKYVFSSAFFSRCILPGFILSLNFFFFAGAFFALAHKTRQNLNVTGLPCDLPNISAVGNSGNSCLQATLQSEVPAKGGFVPDYSKNPEIFRQMTGIDYPANNTLKEIGNTTFNATEVPNWPKPGDVLKEVAPIPKWPKPEDILKESLLNGTYDEEGEYNEGYNMEGDMYYSDPDNVRRESFEENPMFRFPDQ